MSSMLVAAWSLPMPARRRRSESVGEAYTICGLMSSGGSGPKVPPAPVRARPGYPFSPVRDVGVVVWIRTCSAKR
jgi:hypothetical protein